MGLENNSVYIVWRFSGQTNQTGFSRRSGRPISGRNGVAFIRQHFGE
jgi:hypothetical protein